jgi:hypothetical protein
MSGSLNEPTNIMNILRRLIYLSLLLLPGYVIAQGYNVESSKFIITNGTPVMQGYSEKDAALYGLYELSKDLYYCYAQGDALRATFSFACFDATEFLEENNLKKNNP